MEFRLFYKFDIVNDEAVLKTFTLTNEASDYKHSTYKYYEYKEDHLVSQLIQNKNRKGNKLLCSKYVESEVFEDVRNACQVTS